MTDAQTQARASKLAQIRALMFKTVKSGCTEQEARAAAAAVDRLLAKYEIDMDEVTVKEQPIVRLDVKVGDHCVVSSAVRIAAFTDCKVWKDEPCLSYFGFQVDTEISEYLTLVFLRAIDRESSGFLMFNTDYEAAGPRARSDMLLSFGVGMATRLGERLGELKSARDFTQRGTGTDLVLIKLPLVEAAFGELGLRMGRGGRGPSIRDRAAFDSGRAAANTVALNQGIAGRAAQAGRLR